jgi:c-di-GMP-binding flagellar brake protein YcgR
MNWTVISQHPAGFKPDRRKSPRVSVSVQVELREEGSTMPTRVETADLSTGGMYVQMLLALEVGSRLDIVLWLAEQKHCLKGIVVTKHPQFGNGIEFTNMSSESRAALTAFIDAAHEPHPDEPKVQ